MKATMKATVKAAVKGVRVIGEDVGFTQAEPGEPARGRDGRPGRGA
ncbi:hypothetical protein GCM10020001_096850 [Nonomuraea salmonea]